MENKSNAPALPDGRRALEELGINGPTFWRRVKRGLIPERFVLKTGERCWAFDLIAYRDWLRAGRPAVSENTAHGASA